MRAMQAPKQPAAATGDADVGGAAGEAAAATGAAARVDTLSGTVVVREARQVPAPTARALAVACPAPALPIHRHEHMLASTAEASRLSTAELRVIWARVNGGRETKSGNRESIVRAVVWPGVAPRRQHSPAPGFEVTAAAASALVALSGDGSGTDEGPDSDEEDLSEEEYDWGVQEEDEEPLRDDEDDDDDDDDDDEAGDLGDAYAFVAETPEQRMGLDFQDPREVVYIDESEEETPGDEAGLAGADCDDDEEEEEEEEQEEDAEWMELGLGLVHHVEPDWGYAAWAAEEREIERQADSFQSYCDGQDH